MQNVQPHGASLLWTLPVLGDGAVLVSFPDGTSTTVPASVRAFLPDLTQLGLTFYQYQADITGLQPGTTYGYQILLSNAPLTVGTTFFRTAGPGRFSFLVFGDSGQNTSQQKALIALMGAEPDIAFLMHTGDLTYPSGSFALYDAFYYGMNATLFARMPVFPTPGNHDYLANSAAAFVDSHAVPANCADPADRGRYYSFDWSNVHFTCVDSNLLGSAAQDRMLQWLERDLASTQQFWKIVFLHHPPYPTGYHLGDPVCQAVHQNVNPILERQAVHLVLAGHEHAYERTGPAAADQRVDPELGTVYVISGGGGAGLHDVNISGVTDIALEVWHYLRVDVDGASLAMRAIGLDGSELERYVLQPKPSVNPHGIVNATDYSETFGPGSVVSIFGRNLAVDVQTAPASTSQFELGGTSIQFGGQDVPLLYASPRQINAQIPPNAPANGTLRITTANGSAEADLTMTQQPLLHIGAETINQAQYVLRGR